MQKICGIMKEIPCNYFIIANMVDARISFLEGAKPLSFRLSKFLGNFEDVFFNQLIKPMKDLNIDYNEYILIKIIGFFSYRHSIE